MIFLGVLLTITIIIGLYYTIKTAHYHLTGDEVTGDDIKFCVGCGKKKVAFKMCTHDEKTGLLISKSYWYYCNKCGHNT